MPAASPEKCLTPRVSTSKHTPIAFMDDPKSPDPSPLSRADASSSSPEVGNSPELAVRSPRSPSVGEDMTSFVDSFVASILLEEQCATAAAVGNTTAAAEAAAAPVEPSPVNSNDSLEVNVSNSSTAETPSSTEKQKYVVCRSVLENYMLPTEDMSEVHLCEISPINRVWATRRCCTSAKVHLSKRQYCTCKTRCNSE